MVMTLHFDLYQIFAPVALLSSDFLFELLLSLQFSEFAPPMFATICRLLRSRCPCPFESCGGTKQISIGAISPIPVSTSGPFMFGLSSNTPRASFFTNSDSAMEMRFCHHIRPRSPLFDPASDIRRHRSAFSSSRCASPSGRALPAGDRLVLGFVQTALFVSRTMVPLFPQTLKIYLN